jgi:hypothetical protein
VLAHKSVGQIADHFGDMIGPLLIINREMDNTVPWAVANASYRGRSTPSPDRVPATAGVQPGGGHLRVCAGRV